MMPPVFKPPYDSPIEGIFAYEFVKVANPEIDLISQHEVSTICGKFILDFLAVSKDGQRIGIECDGKEFHEHERDEFRDAVILGDFPIDSIYRFRGKDIYFSPHDCLYVMLCLDPDLFSVRGKANTMARSSRLIREVEIDPNEEQICRWDYVKGRDPHLALQVDRRSKNHIHKCRTYWMEIYTFASQLGGGDLNDVMQSFLGRKTGNNPTAFSSEG